MRRVVLALALIAGAISGTAAAVAQAPSVPTTVVIAGGAEETPGRFAISGHLESESRACRVDRAIEISARYGEWTHRHVWAPGDWELVDVKRTGADGSFAATVAATNLWAAKVTTRPVATGRGGHRRVCSSDRAGVRPSAA